MSSPPSPRRSFRPPFDLRSRITAAALHFAPAALAVLACAAPLSGARAQVVLEERSAPAGTYRKLTFVVGGGCDASSATTVLTVRIPPGVSLAHPQAKPNWTLMMRMEDTAAPPTKKTAARFDAIAARGFVLVHGNHDAHPSDPAAQRVVEVTWLGGRLDPNHFDEFGLFVKLPDRPQRLYFDAVQACGTTKVEWTGRPGNARSTTGAAHSGPAPWIDVTAASRNAPMDGGAR